MTKENLNFIPKFDESKGIGFGIYTLGDHIKNSYWRNPLSGNPLKKTLKIIDLKELSVEISDDRNYLENSDDMLHVTTTLMEADMILIGSPTFQASIPATLKMSLIYYPKTLLNKKLLKSRLRLARKNTS